MVKNLLNFLLIFLMLSSFSFAEESIRGPEARMQAKLKNEFGPELRQVPFFLRFSFQKEFNKDWSKTDYVDRFAFLKKYETELAADKAKDKADAKNAKIKEKKRLLEKKIAMQKEKDRLRADQVEQKIEKAEDKTRQKLFDTSIRNQESTLTQMKRLATEGVD